VKNRNINRLLLLCALGISLTVWVQACDDKSETKNIAPKRAVEKDTIDFTKRRADAFHRAQDYMLRINGYYSYKSQLDTMRPIYQDQEDIDYIKSKYTLGGTMTERVINDGVKIIDKSYADIVAEMAKYKMPVDDKIVSNGDEFAILINADSGDEDIIYCYKPDMAFIGAGVDLYQDMGTNFWAFRETYGAFDKLMNAIVDVIDDSVSSQTTKNQIKANIEKIINKTKIDLQLNRKKIEQEYQDYYMIDEFGKKSLGFGDFTFGYDLLDNENINGIFGITRRYTSLNLPVKYYDFLNDTTAHYKLLNPAKNKWTIQKTLKNGTTESINVFNSNASMSECVSVSNAPLKLGADNFEYEYDEDMGLRVYYEQIVKIDSRKKTWKSHISPMAQRSIDSLDNAISGKIHLQQLIEQKKKEADSVAEYAVQKQFENAGR